MDDDLPQADSKLQAVKDVAMTILLVVGPVAAFLLLVVIIFAGSVYLSCATGHGCL